MSKPSVFISYSHKDEDWKDRLVTQLGVLEKQGHLEIWDDRRIEGGDDWFPEIETAIDSAHVAVLMISPQSNASEVSGAFQRSRAVDSGDRVSPQRWGAGGIEN